MTTIFRLCHHQIFNCLVGVWVIEQHAIILSATVCSPTVKQQTKQAEELKCWYGRMLYSAINQHCTCRWPGTKQKQHWYQLLYAHRYCWYQMISRGNGDIKNLFYAHRFTCWCQMISQGEGDIKNLLYAHRCACLWQIISRCNFDFNTMMYADRSLADAMLISTHAVCLQMHLMVQDHQQMPYWYKHFL